MRRRLGLLAGPAAVLALCIVGTTFSILAATSPRWAVQRYYFGSPGGNFNPSSFTSVLCAANRSPFYRCGIVGVYANRSCVVPDCRFYPPAGHNATSCRVASEVGTIFPGDSMAAGTLGGYMECQEVHIAGNLQIASSAFTGFGLLVALVLFAVALSLVGPKKYQRRQDGQVGGAGEDMSLHHRSSHHRRVRVVAPGLTSTLVPVLLIGAILQLLAQFFGVLGLTLNASPNAANVFGAAFHGRKNFGASDWILDIALTRYATVAWAFAVAGAVVANRVLRTIKVEKVL